MISKETNALISIFTNGIILNPKSKKKEKILFSDITKIHIRVLKWSTIVKRILIGHFVLILIELWHLNLELYLFSGIIFSITFIMISSFDIKSYRLQIILKNNTVIEKRVPRELKHEFISFISEVRHKLQINSTSNL